MASGSNSSRDSKNTFDPMDKLSSSTLKRNPKMELCKTDLLKLLSYLEGELQAREIVIATLKAERVKQLLYQAKYGQFSLNDPFAALQRDSYGAYNPNCDEAAIKAMYNNQLSQVENLILQHRRAQQRLRQHLYDVEQQHGKVVAELEEEIRKHAQDTAQGDDVTYMLEKERERLHQEVELERQQNKKLERELKKLVQAMEQDKLRHKQIVMLLLEERKRIVAKLVDEHSKNEEMSQFLSIEKERMTDVVEGLEEESQKSLQMEAELEQQALEFAREREQLRLCLRKETEKNRLLVEEIEALKRELSDNPHPVSSSSTGQPQMMGADGKAVHHSEALLTVNVADDESSSDADSIVDSDPAFKTSPPIAREMTNSIASGVVPVANVVNGSNPATTVTAVTATATVTVPTNASSHCTTASATITTNPPTPPAKPSAARTGGSAAAVTSTPAAGPLLLCLGDSSGKSVVPRFVKSLSPVPSGLPCSSGGLPSPGSTTMVKMVHGATSSSPSPTSPQLHVSVSSQQQQQQQQTGHLENKQQGIVRNVAMSSTTSSAAAAVAALPATTVISSATSSLNDGGCVATPQPPPPPPHVVQVTPRVSVSTSSGARVFTTTQGGKVTFHVTAPPPPQPPKKPASAVAAVSGVGRGAPPPVPPNKPILPKKSDATMSTAAAAAAKAPSSLKFGITISKGDGPNNSAGSSHISLSSSPSASGGPTVITATSMPAPPSSHSRNATSPIFKETQPIVVMAYSPSAPLLPTTPLSMSSSSSSPSSFVYGDPLVDDEDSLAPELADFQQLLVSMAATNSGTGHTTTLTSNRTSGQLMLQNGGGNSQRRSSSPVGRLSAMLDGWKVDVNGSTEADGNLRMKTSPVGTKDRDRDRDMDRDTSSSGSPRKQHVTDDFGSMSSIGGRGCDGLLNGTGTRSSTPAFKPCVRRVESPTMPKSFNHMDL